MWRDVIGYEGLYQVSDEGQVRSLDRIVPWGRSGTTRYKGCLLKPKSIKHKYHAVGLCDGVAKTRRVHRIVAEAFLGPCPEGLEVLHGERGPFDNSLKNLRYGTPSENNWDKYRDGTMKNQPVKRDDGLVFHSVTEAMKQTGSDNSQISKVCRGILKTVKGHTWKFITKEEYENECIKVQ